MAGSSKTTTSVSLLLLFLLFGLTVAKEILVGGKTDAWKVPTSESDSLNKWAARARFQVGDYLGNFISLTFLFFLYSIF